MLYGHSLVSFASATMARLGAAKRRAASAQARPASELESKGNSQNLVEFQVKRGFFTLFRCDFSRIRRLEPHKLLLEGHGMVARPCRATKFLGGKLSSLASAAWVTAW